MVVMTAIFCLCAVATAMNVTVTAQPELEATNRLVNPDVEEGKSSPDGWRTGGARPGEVECLWSDDAFSGEKSLYLASVRGDLTGSWRQYDIEVEPNENLLFSAVVKMESGKVLMYFMGYDDNGKLVYDNRRLYLTAAAEHPLYPTFVEAELLEGTVGVDWQRARMYFSNADNVTSLRLILTLYNNPMPGKVWFDQMYVGIPWVEMSVEVQADEQESGIQRVEIVDDFGRSVYDTGLLREPVRTWKHTLQAAADVTAYTVIVTDEQGDKTEVRYPH
jgi:hypothetical protein